ncbi:MAG: butyrate kinase [Firmicutes bacterium]|nr:butyrate kinase [Bacillota bacterium]
MTYSILVLNSGSTSTKMAVYADQEKVLQKEYSHSRELLKSYPSVAAQLPLREEIANSFIAEEAAAFAPFDAIVARGGLLGPIHSGGYIINQCMVDYLRDICKEEHASNLAAYIAFDLAKKHNIPHAFIYDGVTTDELEPIARISGIADMPRISTTHALNMRATAHKVAQDLHKPYKDLTVAVAHLGGGISMNLHHKGRMVDVVGDDEGPFSPERAGGQQGIQLMKYMEKIPDSHSKLRLMRGNSGFISYFGSNDAREVEKRIEAGDAQAELIFNAMALQIAKSLAGLSVFTCGQLDAIVLTGGLAYSQRLVEEIRRRVSFIAPVLVYPGENEMESLAFGAYRILTGEETAREFTYEA